MVKQTLERIRRQFLDSPLPENILPSKKISRKGKKLLEKRIGGRRKGFSFRLKQVEQKLGVYRNSTAIKENNSLHTLNSLERFTTSCVPIGKSQAAPCQWITPSILLRNPCFLCRRGENSLCNKKCLENMEHHTKFKEKNKTSTPFHGFPTKWTGFDINHLTSQSNFYRLAPIKFTHYLYSLHQHKAGLSRKQDYQRRSSIFKLQLMERKKLGISYGYLSKKDIYKIIERAEKCRGVFNENVFRLLESRLDVILYRIGFFKSIPFARQWIRSGKILVNEKVVTIVNFQLKAGDFISIARRHSIPLKNLMIKSLHQYNFFNYYKNKKQSKYPFFQKKTLLEEILYSTTVNQLNEGMFVKNIHAMLSRGCLSRAEKLLEAVHILLLIYSKTKKQKMGYIRRGGVFAQFATIKKTIFNEKGISFPEGISALHPSIQNLRRAKILYKVLRLVEKETGKKMKDPLFTYKFFILLKKSMSSFYFFRIKKSMWRFFSLKPLHIEISYKKLTAIYLYSPQKIFLATKIDMDQVRNSYH